MCRKCALYILIAVAIKRKKRKEKKNKKKVWCKKLFLQRQQLGQNNLLKTLIHSESDFKNYVRMNENSFEDLLSKVAHIIQKKDTILRKSISARHRLSLTLRFLASGNSFEDLKFLTAISPQRIGFIVLETCKAIIKVLKDYIKFPKSEDEWRMLANEFNERWNFPHCIGAIDGKHINITKPPGTGTEYYNYKKAFSIILLAVVNANCEFIMVDVGAKGRASDGGLFAATKFFNGLTENTLKIPPSEVLPHYNKEMPYVFVADDAFPLMTHIMKPYSHRSLEKDKIVYNYRLSRARGTVEMAFGQLTSKFRVLLKTMNLSPEKATVITLACCYLHNYLRKTQDEVYAYPENVDLVPLTTFESTTSRHISASNKTVRENFSEYFNTAGEVPWQNKIVQNLTIQ